MSAAARRKGHSFERYIARLMRGIGYEKAGRQLEYQANNANGIDLADTGRYKIQLKKTKKYVPMTAIEEVRGKNDDIAVLIAAGDSQPPLVVMYLPDWLELVSNNMTDMNTKPMSSDSVQKLIREVKGLK